jgi:hypothetical protein
MQPACFLVWLTAAVPLWRAWQANQHTSLLQAVHWAILSWASWGVAVASVALWPAFVAQASGYVALSLTGCAAVAVLGARRPGVRAWNFVVVALLAVDLLPLAESMLTGSLPLNGLRLTCLAGTLAVGVCNYLPTRFAPAALALLLGCALELAALLTATPMGHEPGRMIEEAALALAVTPWIAYACRRRGNPSVAEFDRLWLDFRDRYGFVWSQRVREQFNRSAANAGWPVVLRWQGLRLRPGTLPPEPATQTKIVATLHAFLKRFGPDEPRSQPDARSG